MVGNQITTLPPQESEYHTARVVTSSSLPTIVRCGFDSFENAAFETVVQTLVKSLRPSVAEAHQLLKESHHIGIWALFRFYNWCFDRFFFG